MKILYKTKNLVEYIMFDKLEYIYYLIIFAILEITLSIINF